MDDNFFNHEERCNSTDVTRQAHDSLKFTIERENNIRIPFLDTMFIREGNSVHTNWYKKPIASGRLLNFLSSHPYDVKRGIATAFAKRVISLSHPKYHTENYKIIVDILIKNNYPMSMVNKIIKNMTFCNRRTNTTTFDPAPQNGKPMKYRGLPYISILSEKIKNNLSKLDDNNIKIVMYKNYIVCLPKQKLR